MSESKVMASDLKEAQENLGQQICRFFFLLSEFAAFVLLSFSGIMMSQQGLSLSFTLMILPLFSWILMSKWVKIAFWTIVIVYTAFILVAIILIPFDTIFLLLSFPPVMATVLINPRAGMVLAALATVLVLGGGDVVGTPSAEVAGIALLVIWGMDVLAWGMVRFTYQGMEWSWLKYQRNAELLEDARDQRLELKQTQEDLMQANAELARLSDRLDAMRSVAEQARRSKEEFVANVSHELRTPLNMIIGFSEMIMKTPHAYGEIPSALLADIGVILRNSRHLAEMVDDVLDLSQADASPLGLSKEWVRVCEIVSQAETAVRPLFLSKGIDFEVEAIDDELRLFCDSTRIRQVLLNLLNNAARFTEHGSVRIGVCDRETEVIVSVADTGSGIPSEDQERIFEPFRQAGDSILQRHGGTGLGLSISKRFVELHGGRMWLESEVGAGSTFYFSLPKQPESASKTDDLARWFSPYESHETRRSPSRASRLDILPRFVVLESSDTLRRFLERFRDDAEIIPVTEREEAIQELARSPAQALIVNEDPFGAEEREWAWLSDLPYETPTIICWVPGPKEAASRLGVRDYLLKPVSHEDLLASLRGLEDVESVLVVDDEAEAVQLFSRMLRTAECEYRILRALNGQRALRLLREQRPDVVLLDLVMPGVSGYEVLQEKARDPQIRDIPVIAVSAQDPAQTPAGSRFLTVSRGGGLSIGDLLRCIQEISVTLAPASADQVRSRTPLA